MTLLVLPLVESSSEVDARHPFAYVGAHSGLLLSFVISFLVIHAFWTAHGSAVRRLHDSPVDVAALGPLTMAWLLVVVFLPFPTAVVGRDLTTSSASAYIGTMVVLSALTSAITTAVERRLGGTNRIAWTWATTAVFGICALLSLVDAELGLFALLSLAALRVVEVRRRGRAPAAPG